MTAKQKKTRTTPTTKEIQAEAGRKGAIISGRVKHALFPTDLIEPDISFVTFGIPAPQGSKKLIGNNRFVESSPGLEPWRKAIKEQAKETILYHGKNWHGAIDKEVLIVVTFTLPHSQASLKRGDTYHYGSPDLDKLQRAVGDALSPTPLKKGITKGMPPAEAKRHREKLKKDAAEYTVLQDDKFIVAWQAKKVYVGGASDALKHPGAVIEVWSIDRLNRIKENSDD